MKQIMCPTIAILFVVLEFCCNKIILLLLKILYCNKKYCCNIKLLSNSPTFFFLSNTIKWNFAHKITKRKKKNTKPHQLWICNVWGVVHSGSAMGEELDRLIVVGLVSEDFLGSCFLALVLAVVAWVIYRVCGAWSVEGVLAVGWW